MAATIEVNYFNSFWLKKVVKNGDTDPSWPGLPWNPYGAFSVAIGGVNTGYSTSNDVTTTRVSGTGGGLIVDIIASSVFPNPITAVKIVNPGINIASGDQFTVDGGGGNCTLTLTTKPFPFGSGGVAGTPKSGTQNYYLEEARIKGGFNNKITDLGVRAYSVNENRDKIDRSHSLIFSGVYNVRTGYNETNVFSVADPIIKDAEPINGSIQKLYSEDTNLLIFQENKVSKALINKTTIYSGEQGANEVLGSPTFIGQIVPYLGEYGISKNPESFAIFGYRKYFIDRNRAAILRLSRDGITEISAYGMRDFFRDYLSTITNEYKATTVYKVLTTSAGTHSSVTVTSDTCCAIEVGAEISLYNSTTQVVTPTTSVVTQVSDGGATCTVSVSPDISIAAGDDEIVFITYRKDKALGGYDIHNQNYVVSLQTKPANISKEDSTFTTVSFDEGAQGWTSFYTYKPNQLGSLKNKFYSFYTNTIYEHYDETTANNRGKFYGATTPADTSITFIFNPNPTVVKNFNTVAYEGGNGWEVDSFKSDFEGIDPDIPFTNPLAYNASNQYQDTTNSVKSYEEGKYSTSGVIYRAGFNRKENKYVANLVSSSVARPGEIIFGSQVSGIKGYIATVKLSTDATTDSGGMKELFSVSSNFVVSSY